MGNSSIVSATKEAQSDEESRKINFLLVIRRSPAEFVTSVIIGVFLLVNFLHIGDYGMTYDEPAGLKRGKDAEQIISSVFSGAPFTIEHWDFQNHPTFYALLDYEFAKALMALSVQCVPAVHALNIITGTAGLIVLFLFARRLFNSRIACLAVLVMSLSPRFIANVHYNGKDIPVMVFSTLTLYFLYRALTEGRKLYWILGGIVFGMSIDTKLDALIILPIMFTSVAIATFLKQTSVPVTLRSVTLFVCISILSVYLFWPLLWLDPFHPIEALRFWGGHFNSVKIMYLGRYLGADEVPWHYMPVHLLATTPVIVVIFGMLGAAILFRTFRQNQKQFEVLLLASWVFWPLLPRLFRLMLQYGGMRHVFISVPPLAVISAVGFDFCLSWIMTNVRSRTVGPAFCGAISVWLLFQCRQAHPYEGSYLNEITRLVLPGDGLGNFFDFYSWCAPLKDGIAWLNQNAPKDAVVMVVKKGWLTPLLNSYPLRDDIKLVESGPADFAMELSELHSSFIRGDPVFTVKCYDTPLLRIYKVRRQ